MIYILFDYEEHGPELSVATTIREELPKLLVDTWVDTDEAKKKLIAELENTDSELIDKQNIELKRGWGGVCLRVLKDGIPSK